MLIYNNNINHTSISVSSNVMQHSKGRTVGQYRQEVEKAVQELEKSSEEYKKSVRVRTLLSRLKSGEDLSKEELSFLDKHAPALKKQALKIKEERENFKKALKNCKNKEQVQKLKKDKEMGLNIKIQENQRTHDIEEEETNKECLKALEQEYNKFVKTTEYKILPARSYKDNVLINEYNRFSRKFNYNKYNILYNKKGKEDEENEKEKRARARAI